MYKIYFGNILQCLLFLFKSATDVHSYCTHNVSLNFHKINCYTTMYKNSF